jgi:hypothetical protein
MKKIATIFSLLTLVLTNANAQIILSNDTTLCGTFGYDLQAVSSTSTSITSDDTHGSAIPIGFTFNFYGVAYTQLVVSGNGYVTFDLSQANQYSPWAINAAIPNPGNVPQNAIMAPWQDIDPGPPAGGSITYGTIGTAPNRMLLVTWCAVPMFSCTSDLHTSQIILYEGSNKIEMFIKNKPLCATWNSGAAIQGLVNANSTNFDIVNDPNIAGNPARNLPLQWTATNEAWEFIPNGSIGYTINQITYLPIVAGVANWYSDPLLTNFITSGPSLPISNTVFNNTTGVYTYYSQITGSCLSGTGVDSVTVTYDASCCDFAGDDDIIDLCDTDPPLDLFTILNNSPSLGGVWEDQSGNSISNFFDPANDPSGTYNYIIVANGSCIADTGFVNININNISTLLVSPESMCSGINPVTLTPNLIGGIFSGANVPSPNTFNPIVAGNNTITYTSGGCSTPVNLTVLQSPAILTQNITQPICPGDSTGTAVINVNGIAPPYIFDWYGENNLELPQGTFNFTITDTNLCSFDGSVTIYDPADITPVITPYNVSCYGANDGSIGITINNPSTPPGTVSTLVYCASSPSTNPNFANAASSSIIANVILNGDNNNINNPTPAVQDLYEDYTTTQYADITEGQSYIINITLDGIGSPANQNYSGAKVYIDYNINGDFTDAGEEVGIIPYTTPSTVGNSVPINFTVPVTGVYGPTRMRIVSQYNISGNTSSIGPCDEADAGGLFGTPWHGASEDYSIVLNTPTINSTIVWTHNLSISDSITALAPGTYTSIITSNGCPFEDSVQITEPEELFFNANIIPIVCHNTTGQISISPSGGNGGPYNVIWGTVDSSAVSAGIDTITIEDLSTITPYNLNACRVDTPIVMIQPDSFSVAFTTSSDEICLNDPVTLNFDFNQGGIPPFTINYTENGIVQSFGPINNNGPMSIPVAPVVGNNVYIISNIIDNDGCVNQNIINPDSIDVNPLPNINISIDPNPICIGDSSTLSFFAIAGTSPWLINYTIDGTPYTTTIPLIGSTDTIVKPNLTTNYTLTYVVDSAGCELNLIDQQTLIVNENPQVNFTSPTQTCIGDLISLDFEFTAGVSPWSVNYSIDGIPTVVSFNNTLSSISISPNTQTIYIVDSITDNNNCVTKINDTSTISTSPKPEVYFSGGGPICPNDSAEILFEITSGTPPYELIYANGINLNLQSNIISNYSLFTSQNGVYSIDNVTDSLGCQATSITGSAYVSINPFPEADITAYPQPANISDPEITFIDLSTGHVSGVWDFDDGTTSLTNFNKLTHIYGDTGTFNVLLSIVSDSGCTDTAWQKVIISPSFIIYIPNAFTPNNDLNNDYFLPIVDGVSEYEFNIYTRSGQTVFTTNDFSNNYLSCITDNNCSAAWDGKINNGTEYATKGVYVYSLVLTDINGKIRTYEGTVMLIR